MKPNWTVCLIARNEEKTLPRLLGSLKEFQERGGEVILVDTGSTDNTVKVATDLGCLVTEVGEIYQKKISKEFEARINKFFIDASERPMELAGRIFDYSAARNFAASLSQTDMVAMPDCDEVYTKLDIDQINKTIASGVDQLEYNFVFFHDAFGNEVIKFMHSKFYNHKKMKWVGTVHEILQGDAKREFLPEQIIKLEHFQNPDTNREGYLRGLAIDCYNDQANDRNAHYFGRELLYKGRPKSAFMQLARHVAMNKWQPEKSQSLVYMGDAAIMMGDEKAAITHWTAAFDTEAGRREPLMRLAEFYFKKHSPQHTAAYAAAALQIKESNFYANDRRHYTSLPHELLYWALWLLGDKAGSKEHWEKALGYEPLNSKYLHDTRFYQNLPKVSFVLPHMGTSKQRTDGLAKSIASIKALNYPEELIELIVVEDTLENRQGVPKKVKEGVEKSTGRYIVYASNDIEFEPDSLMIAINELQNNPEVFLLAFNTGEISPDEGNINEHFIFEKSFLDSIGGEIFDTELNHVGVDNLLWAKCKKLGGAMRSANAKATHHHFSKGAPMDDVYKLGWSEVDSDRALLAKKLKELGEK